MLKRITEKKCLKQKQPLKMQKNYYNKEKQEQNKNQNNSRLKMKRRLKWQKFKPKLLLKGF